MRIRTILPLFFIFIIICVQCVSAMSYDIILGSPGTKCRIWYPDVIVKDYGTYYEYDFGKNVNIVAWQIYIPELRYHNVSIYVTVEKSGNGVSDLVYTQKEFSVLSIMPLKIGNLIKLPNSKVTYRLDFKQGKPYIVLTILSEDMGDVTVKLYKNIRVYVHEEEQVTPAPIQTPKPITIPKISINITDIIGYIVVGSALAVGILVGIRRW